MNTSTSIQLLACLLALTGCKNKEAASDASAIAEQETTHQPSAPKYAAQYDRSVPAARVDVEKAIADSANVPLSKVASSIEYYLVGDDKYPITDVVATADGFIGLNKPKLYLYRKGMKRKRVGLKTEYGNWHSNESMKDIYYDKSTFKLYAYLKEINQETGYADRYLTQLPPLDSVLARVHYLYPDSLPVTRQRVKAKEGVRLFSSAMYIEPWGQGIEKGIITFAMNGDTICKFESGIDSLGIIPEHGFSGYKYEVAYWYDQKPTFMNTYCDTIYRLADECTIVPTYALYLGKHRATAPYLFNGGNRKNKAWPTDLKENPKGLFLKIYKEGKSNKSGWLNDKSERDEPAIEHQVVYLKASAQTYALPVKTQGLTNDLDGGLPFWPDGQTDEYLYMIRPAKQLKAAAKLNGSPRQKELKAFLESIDEKQNVMIVVK